MAKINALRRGIRGMMHGVKDRITPPINDIKSFVRNPDDFRVRNPKKSNKIDEVMAQGMALATIGALLANDNNRNKIFNTPPKAINAMRDVGLLSSDRASKVQQRYSNVKNKIIQAVPQLRYNNNIGASNSATKKRMKKSKYL